MNQIIFVVVALFPADSKAGVPAGVNFVITGDIISPALSYFLYYFLHHIPSYKSAKAEVQTIHLYVGA